MNDDIVPRATAGNWHSAKIVAQLDKPHTFQDKEFYKPMTDDIVTRLREKYLGQLSICLEAADEIERLRAEQDKLRTLLDDFAHWVGHQMRMEYSAWDKSPYSHFEFRKLLNRHKKVITNE